MNERLEYSITIDWYFDFELLYLVQKSIDDHIKIARTLKSNHYPIANELDIIRELQSIRKQIKDHGNLS